MKKEIIISVVILILVIILDIITQRYTNTTMYEISQELTKIREDLFEERIGDVDSKIDRVIEDWNKYKEKLMIFIEHDELEKVEMYVLETKSYIETKQYDMGIQSLDTGLFIIDHIIEKYKFTWKSIF